MADPGSSADGGTGGAGRDDDAEAAASAATEEASSSVASSAGRSGGGAASSSTPAAAGKVEEEPPLPSLCSFDHGGGWREVSIVTAIEEYLSYHDLQGPLEAFRRDVERADLRRVPSKASKAVVEDIEGVLMHFDGGRRLEFDEAWRRVMPESFRLGRDGRSLALRLEAHFSIFRARQSLQAAREPDAKQLQADLEPFRAFLGNCGLDEVCGDEALLPLFALPFVQRPYAQSHVSSVFTAKWLHDLRRAVEAALRSQQPHLPLLYGLLEAPPTVCGDRDADTWRAVWAELLLLADFGLAAADLGEHGVPIPMETIAKGRRRLDALREHIPGGFDLRLHGSPSPGPHPMSPSRSLRSRAATAPPQMPRDLDFGRLAQFIRARPEERPRFVAGVGGGAGAAPPTMAAVLRALLQRLASAEAPVPDRRGFLVAVACFDVLGVSARPQTLSELLADPELAELALGILAVLACEAVGRTYIVANLGCVEAVAEILKTQPLDSSMHIQALAAMQRLSLRRAPQDRMIALGIVEWVLACLGWHGEAIQGMPSEFSLEFGSAMLMNLALRTEGKRRCHKSDALSVALNLMEHWNPQIRTHVNGTLYSLLSLPSFRADARARGLEGVLSAIYQQAASVGDEISKRQLEYLLEQLALPNSPAGSVGGADGGAGSAGGGAAGGADPGTESGEDDEDDDEDFLEEEELAGLLLGDRGGKSAEEALCGFLLASSPPGTAEAQFSKFRAFLSRGHGPRAA